MPEPENVEREKLHFYYKKVIYILITVNYKLTTLINDLVLASEAVKTDEHPIHQDRLRPSKEHLAGHRA